MMRRVVPRISPRLTLTLVNVASARNLLLASISVQQLAKLRNHTQRLFDFDEKNLRIWAGLGRKKPRSSGAEALLAVAVGDAARELIDRWMLVGQEG